MEEALAVSADEEGLRGPDLGQLLAANPDAIIAPAAERQTLVLPLLCQRSSWRI